MNEKTKNKSEVLPQVFLVMSLVMDKQKGQKVSHFSSKYFCLKWLNMDRKLNKIIIYFIIFIISSTYKQNKIKFNILV